MRLRWLATAGAIMLVATAAGAQRQGQEPPRIGGKPNFNGIWQALNTAYWNLEDHSAEGLKDIWQLGAIAAIPAGQSVVRGGTIPYKPEALAKRNENRARWPAADPEAKCYMPDRSELPVDSWMGKSDGTWDGDVLVVTTKWQNGQSWLDRAGNYASNQLTVTERFTLQGPNHLSYEATLDDPQTFTRPWTIEMPLYRIVDAGAQLLEHKCVP